CTSGQTNGPQPARVPETAPGPRGLPGRLTDDRGTRSVVVFLLPGGGPAVATPASPVESQYVDFGRAFQFFFEDPEWQKKTLMRMIMLQRFSAGFEIRENIELIKRAPGNYFIALAIYLVTHILASFAMYLCCLPYFPAAFWALCVGMWAMGEVVRRDSVLGG